MIRSWLKLRRYAKIGAEEHRAKFGDQFLALLAKGHDFGAVRHVDPGIPAIGQVHLLPADGGLDGIESGNGHAQRGVSSSAREAARARASPPAAGTSQTSVW